MVNTQLVKAADYAWDYLTDFSWHSTQADTPVALLRDLQLLEDTVSDMRLEIVRRMRARNITWAEVGEALGMTPQGARQHYKPRGIA